MAVRPITELKSRISENLAKKDKGSIKKEDVFNLLEDTLDTLRSMDNDYQSMTEDEISDILNQ